jgi:predicted small lipoprotein YifL
MSIKWIVAVATCAMLAACGSSGPGGSPPGLPPSHAKPAGAAHPASLVRGRPRAAGAPDMVAAVSGEKSGVPVEVRFALRERPEVGQPVELDVEVTPTAPLGRLVTSFHAEDGLTIEEGGGASESDRPVPGTPLSRTLKIVARRNGIFYVNATVLVEAGADSVARTFTMPVIAGAGAN